MSICGKRGIAIFLSPIAIEAYINTNEMLLGISDINSNNIYCSQFISIDLQFMSIIKKHRAYKRKSKTIKTILTIILIYYLYINSKYKEMLEFISVKLLNLRNK